VVFQMVDSFVTSQINLFIDVLIIVTLADVFALHLQCEIHIVLGESVGESHETEGHLCQVLAVTIIQFCSFISYLPPDIASYPFPDMCHHTLYSQGDVHMLPYRWICRQLNTCNA
jgi:hypothetical protein